jgi:hypothetical protein
MEKGRAEGRMQGDASGPLCLAWLTAHAAQFLGVVDVDANLRAGRRRVQPADWATRQKQALTGDVLLEERQEKHRRVPIKVGNPSSP